MHWVHWHSILFSSSFWTVGLMLVSWLLLWFTVELSLLLLLFSFVAVVVGGELPIPSTHHTRHQTSKSTVLWCSALARWYPRHACKWHVNTRRVVKHAENDLPRLHMNIRWERVLWTWRLWRGRHLSGYFRQASNSNVGGVSYSLFLPWHLLVLPVARGLRRAAWQENIASNPQIFLSAVNPSWDSPQEWMWLL